MIYWFSLCLDEIRTWLYTSSKIRKPLDEIQSRAITREIHDRGWITVFLSFNFFRQNLNDIYFCFFQKVVWQVLVFGKKFFLRDVCVRTSWPKRKIQKTLSYITTSVASALKIRPDTSCTSWSKRKPYKIVFYNTTY